MRLLVIGQGGREHALYWRLNQCPSVERTYCIPGNGGIPEEDRPADDLSFEKLAAFARENVDLTVVGPEQPLTEGIVDFFRDRGLKIFGPTAAAARIEGEKSFAKAICQKAQVPTARYEVVTSKAEAAKALRSFSLPVVLKADGLAAGKGVFVCHTRLEAEEATEKLLEEKIFGKAGERVVVEEFLAGKEFSAFALCSDEACVLLGAAQDYKRLRDGDRGPNTGGMGCYSPVPFFDAELREKTEGYFEATLRALAAEGAPYRGVLYMGAMLTREGPKLLEYNCRFGDPEAQVLLPRTEGDVAEVLYQAAEGRLLQWCEKNLAAACVVLASRGYPLSAEKGVEIHGVEEAAKEALVFHAGTKREDGKLLTWGGRVLSVVGLGQDLPQASTQAYAAVEKITFEGMQVRRDIARP